MKKKIKVLIVEDSALMRQALTRIINSDQRLVVVGAARDGIEGVEMARNFKPDVVTIDLNLPEMDGLTCLQYIMVESSCPCIIISAHTKKGSMETFEALELGAVDFVEKPSGEISRDIGERSKEITNKIKQAVYVNMAVIQRQKLGAWVSKEKKAPSGKVATDKVVVIGVSTGGPRTLMQIIPSLPPDLNAPVVVVQHMPKNFTGSFAERMDSHSILPVREAINMEPLRDGTVYVTPGDKNLCFMANGDEVRISLQAPETDLIYTPSVERCLDSAIDVFGKRAIGVILTGMGNDGASAMERLYKLGGETIAESEETAVIYGMPKEVFIRGAARVIAPSFEIADTITEAVERVDDRIVDF